MTRKELNEKLEICAYSSYEYSETAREALFALQKDDRKILSLKEKIETLKERLAIATANNNPEGSSKAIFIKKKEMTNRIFHGLQNTPCCYCFLHDDCMKRSDEDCINAITRFVEKV